jgi:hypothetical protein
MVKLKKSEWILSKIIYVIDSRFQSQTFLFKFTHTFCKLDHFINVNFCPIKGEIIYAKKALWDLLQGLVLL